MFVYGIDYICFNLRIKRYHHHIPIPLILDSLFFNVGDDDILVNNEKILLGNICPGISTVPGERVAVNKIRKKLTGQSWTLVSI